MDRLIASIQAYDPTIKIGIQLPPVYGATPNPADGSFPAQKQAAMWETRKQILDTWDNATFEAAGVTVVDAGSALDPVYGFDTEQVLPFAQYTGTLTRTRTIDAVHPSAAGFQQLGIGLAAWVQAVR